MSTSLRCPICNSGNVITSSQSNGGEHILRQYGEYTIDYSTRECKCGYFCNKGKHFLSEDSKEWKAWESEEINIPDSVSYKTLESLFFKAQKNPKLIGGNS